MKTYIVLFRGINVGGKNILPMKELASLLSQNHYENIKTYIQSGNVVLDSNKNPATRISEIVKNSFDFKPEIFILTESELMAATRNNPYADKEGKTVHFYFFQSALKADEVKLNEIKSESEEYLIKGKVCYLFAPEGIGRSKFVRNIETCLSATVTGRNLNIVNKLQGMAIKA